MKIIHTSDWHLGKRLERFSMLKEQESVLQEICEIAEQEQVNAVIVSGDLFDTFNPAAEAVELFYKYLKKLANDGKRMVIAIAGNHDSPERIEAPDPLARECGIVFAGFPNTVIAPFGIESGIKITKSEAGFIEVQIPDVNFLLRVLFTPYANELRLKKFLGHDDNEKMLRTVLQQQWERLSERYCDEQQGVNILASHLLFIKKGGEPPEEPEEEKPILNIGGASAIHTENLPKRIQYAALGHLHHIQTVDTNPCPVVYSGSPLSYSFSEVNQDKFVKLIELMPGKKAEIKDIPLISGKKLVRKRFENIDKAVEWLRKNPNVYVELTLVSDTFLEVTDRKRIIDAHENIVQIIPEVKNYDQQTGKSSSGIDLSKSMEELFIEYFRSKKGQKPNERIVNLFKETLSEDG